MDGDAEDADVWECKACLATISPRPDSEPTGFCDPCAQSAVAELQEKIDFLQKAAEKVVFASGDHLERPRLDDAIDELRGAILRASL